MKKWIILTAVLVILGGGAAYAFLKGDKDDNQGPGTVKVETGTLVEKALAMGEIVPRHQIAVKSKVSGTVARLFVEEGQAVAAGDPLLEVRPSPTPLEYAQARRTVELRTLAEEQRRADLDRATRLMDRGMTSRAECDRAHEEHESAAVQRRMAEEELAILDRGRAVVAGRTVENIITSPVAGRILDIAVDVGDPVVPLTSYQPGTELMSLANMEQLVFEGTVDEIDVGKIHEGLHADIKVGAFPNKVVPGQLSRIALKSQKRDNATVFEVEINGIQAPEGVQLRAGYSANADIIIRRAQDVPVIPERVVTFRSDSAFVRLPAPSVDQQPQERAIEVGMSDGVNIEVKGGLALGDTVLDKETREIK